MTATFLLLNVTGHLHLFQLMARRQTLDRALGVEVLDLRSLFSIDLSDVQPLLHLSHHLPPMRST